MTWNEKTSLLMQETTMAHLFDVLCENESQEFAVWLEGDEVKSYNYRVLRERSFACAENILKLGFGKEGGWTGIAADTCIEWPIIFWGLLAAGRNVILLDPSLDDKGIEHLMKQAGADSLVSGKKRGLAYDIKSPAEVLGTAVKSTAGFKPRFADLIAACTSGTTTTSRVYVYNGRAICEQVVGFSHHQPYPCFTCEEMGPVRTVAFLPMNHIFGLVTNVITTPFQNCPQIFLKDRSPKTIMETCQKCGAQMILTVPLLVNSISTTISKRVAAEKPVKRAAFKAMQGISLFCQRINPRFGLKVGKKLFKNINKNLFGDSLLQIVVGGAHVPEEHMRMVNSLGYAVTVGFGMTETCITSYENKLDLKSRISGSVGLPLKISTYTVVPDGSDPNRGELLIKCTAMHIGRMENGVLLPPAVDADGWFHTGDIVRIGSKGRMWIEGRAKDVIIGESGENVYPDEIEDTFAGMEGVEQLSVLGIDKNGKEQIALVMNVAERFGDISYLNRLSVEVDKRNRTLRPLKRATLFYVTPDSLPIVSAIKVKRADIRKHILDGTMRSKRILSSDADDTGVSEISESPKQEQTVAAAAAPAASVSTENGADIDAIKKRLRECFAEELEVDVSTISDDARFVEDLGGDSLHRLGALLRVEDEFGVVIPEEKYEYCTSVTDLAKVILSISNGSSAESTPDKPAVVTPITDFEQTREYKEFAERLSHIPEGKNPYFVCHESPLKDTSLMDGKEVLNFGSYNYTGMSGRKETAEAAKAAIDKYGTSASGSRLLAGEKKLYQELEKELAEWKHAESALVLVGGHSTNVTLVGNFCGKNDLILYDVLDHNSIREGCRLSEADARFFPHNDTEALERILKVNRQNYEKVLIVVEGAYSMDGDVAPIPELVRIKKEYGCFLMVDEAHSACVLGKTGGGVDEYFGLAHDDVDLKMGTLSKGLGACGGYVAGKESIITYLRYNLPGFVFSVGISPALAAEVLEAIRILKKDPSVIESLHENIRCFVSEAKKRKLNICLAGETAIIPVLVGSDDDAFAMSNKLCEMGVFVPPAVYPAVPQGKARLRFCVTSDHKPEQIRTALDATLAAAKELGINLPAGE